MACSSDDLTTGSGVGHAASAALLWWRSGDSSGASAAVAGSFEISSPTAGGLTHHYSSFRAVADEVVQARVWGGVHWRTSCTAGRAMGQRIGRYVISTFGSHPGTGGT